MHLTTKQKQNAEQGLTETLLTDDLNIIFHLIFFLDQLLKKKRTDLLK